MAKFGIDMKGRVKNFPLNPHQNNAHLPVLEAIVNSIQAVYEKIAKENLLQYDGVVRVEFSRESDLIDDNRSKIESVIITDNGIGFDEKNFKEFLTSDTEHKKALGGKGVGRFSWLKAFSSVVVTSTFIENGEYLTRTFEFNINAEELDDKLEDSKKKEVSTAIVLKGSLPDFRKHFPVGMDVWANRILKHCMKYFLEKECCPAIILTDGIATINLRNEFNEKVSELFKQETFKIGDKAFTLTHLKVNKTILDRHAIVLFGNNRSVLERDLASKLVDMADVELEDGARYLCLVESPYLDDHVDLNRLAFNLPIEETERLNAENEIALDRIISEVVAAINITLKDYLKPVREQKEIRIKAYIKNQAPRYAFLLRHRADDIMNIVNGTDDKIDEQLYKISRKFEEDERQGRLVLERQLKDETITDEEYDKKLKECIAKIVDANKSRLADYVAHRKIVIDLFEQGMRRTSGEDYSKEEYMHKLIYPMKTTSDEVSHEEQNLWLIDERLSYFSYIASDTNLNPNKDRPDLIMFDTPISLIEEQNEGKPLNKIVIFELKRPMRDGVDGSDNPIQQITKYKSRLEDGKTLDKNGRPIKVDEKTQFYLYVICDITDKLKKELVGTYGLTETVDGYGFYGFRGDTTFIEVLSYDKIVSDAKKRNQILFEKLGIN